MRMEKDLSCFDEDIKFLKILLEEAKNEKFSCFSFCGQSYWTFGSECSDNCLTEFEKLKKENIESLEKEIKELEFFAS